MFKPLHAENLSEKIIQQIDTLINTGELKPGDKLPSERELAKQLNISRGILREALKSLESLGYLTRKTGDGTYIRDMANHNNFVMDLSDRIKYATYMDLFEARLMLEEKIVELAIKRATDEELEEIKKTTLDVNKISESDDSIFHFHSKLALSTKNIILVNFMASNYELIKKMAIITNQDSLRQEEMLSEHRAILDAVSERNLSKAQDTVRAHFKNALNKVQENCLK